MQWCPRTIGPTTICLEVEKLLTLQRSDGPRQLLPSYSHWVQWCLVIFNYCPLQTCFMVSWELKICCSWIGLRMAQVPTNCSWSKISRFTQVKFPHPKTFTLRRRICGGRPANVISWSYWNSCPRSLEESPNVRFDFPRQPWNIMKHLVFMGYLRYFG